MLRDPSRPSRARRATRGLAAAFTVLLGACVLHCPHQPCCARHDGGDERLQRELERVHRMLDELHRRVDALSERAEHGPAGAPEPDRVRFRHPAAVRRDRLH